MGMCCDDIVCMMVSARFRAESSCYEIHPHSNKTANNAPVEMDLLSDPPQTAHYPILQNQTPLLLTTAICPALCRDSCHPVSDLLPISISFTTLYR